MGRLEVAPGIIAVAEGRLVSVTAVNPNGSITVRDLASGIAVTIEASVVCARPVESVPVLEPDVAIVKAGDQQWQAARHREAALRSILECDGAFSAQVGRAAMQMKVSKRTVYRWLTRYVRSPQTTTLLPRVAGNPKGRLRLDASVEQLIAQAIDNVYLSRTPGCKEDVVREVARLCRNAQLAAPARNTILQRLTDLDRATVMRLQRGGRETRQRLGFVPGQLRAAVPLDIVQIDHTLVDVIVVDEVERRAIGRPWITLAIDVATRLVLGLTLSLEAPSATSVALCLTQACLPKERWLAARGIEAQWPIWGLPRLLHADNGPEFKSKALCRGCDEFGIALMLRPVATPHYGGHIERLIGTLMGRVHLLPGTTFSNPQERGSYPSEDKAAMTLRELEHWLVTEICGHYHRSVHASLGITPLAAWEQAANCEALKPRLLLPDDPQRFVISFLPYEQRQLRRDGLHLFCIRYWDSVLPRLAALEERMLVRFDPRDLSKVYVLGKDKRYTAIPYADLRRPPISIWEQRTAIRWLRDAGHREIDEQKIFEAIAQQRKLATEAVQRTRSTRRQEESRRQSQIGRPSATPAQRCEVDYSKPAVPSDVELWGF